MSTKSSVRLLVIVARTVIMDCLYGRKSAHGNKRFCSKVLLVLAVFSALPSNLECITTIHHDKPMTTKQAAMRMQTAPPPVVVALIPKPLKNITKLAAPATETAETPLQTNASLTSSERQRRLVPYMTFYLSNNFNQPTYQIVGPKAQNYQPLQSPGTKYKTTSSSNAGSRPLQATNYQLVPQQQSQPQQQQIVKLVEVIQRPQKIKYTPFLDTNKIPGHFTPIQGQRPQAIKIQYIEAQGQPPRGQEPQQYKLRPVPQGQGQPQPQPQQSPAIPQPDYSIIYDKLSQLKLQYNLTPQPPNIKQVYQLQPQGHQGHQSPQSPQDTRFNPYLQKYNPNLVRRPASYIPLHEYQEQQQTVIQQPRYKPSLSGVKAFVQTYAPPPSSSDDEGSSGSGTTGTSGSGIPIVKTVVQTYTPATIDIPSGGGHDGQSGAGNGGGGSGGGGASYEIYEPQNEEEYVQIPPPSLYEHRERRPQQQIIGKPYTVEAVIRPKPIGQPPKQYLVEVIPSTQKQYYHHTSQNGRIPLKPLRLEPVAVKLNPKYAPNQYPVSAPIPQSIPPTTGPPPYLPTDDSNTLARILKNLQESNALPHTLTPDNIDNSIKTLVRILTSLKTSGSIHGAGVPPVRGKFSKPIVVADDTGDYEETEDDNDALLEVGSPHGGGGIVTSTVSQSFPASTPEGGTPGQPGIDYPALSRIPKTSFNCKTQRYKGFFGDPDTNCQVWHYCDLNGGQASFLCPNGTIFSQVALTCDWWYNVKCSTTTQLYVLNERLYKYILPFRPKFPEDYSGPLVDKYLALKFQEMEERMRKEKKGKGGKAPSSSDVKEVDELQLLEDGNNNRIAAESSSIANLDKIEHRSSQEEQEEEIQQKQEDKRNSRR